MIRAALYYRVSTGDQTVEHQRVPCRELCDRLGWRWIPEHEIEEIGSGAAKRPGWDRVLTLARERKVQRVVAWSIDRIGRSLWGIVDSVRALDDAGAPLTTVQEPWLMVSNDTRPIMVAFFGWLADYERKRLIARTHEGLATARRKGKTLGRPRRLTGQALADALDLRIDGKSWGEIAALIKARHGKAYNRTSIATAVQRLQDGLT